MQAIDPLELHDRQAKAVTRAIVKLLEKLGPDGYTPEVIAQGAIHAAGVVLIAGTGCGASDVSKLLADIAHSFDELDTPNQTAVQ